MAAFAFNRAGFAALHDLDAPGYKELFHQLERVQEEFLARLDGFADERYPWDRDTLHNWSRAWEYAYVLHHVRREIEKRNSRLSAVDFGSGSTFFPFAVARLGVDLICLDNDPIVAGDLEAATRCIDPSPGTLRVLQNDAKLPLESASADLLYSISVLEHMPDPVPIVEEIARVLRPDGLLILTIDVDVEGHSGVSVADFDRLREQIERLFTLEFAERTVHPMRMLTSMNSPWPRPGERHVPALLLRTKKKQLRPIIGGPSPGVLTVYGAVARRKR